MQTKMDPCFYKMVLYKVASMAEVWYKPECPLLLFPLPLPWCAPRPWLPLWGSWHGAAVTEGATTGLASCALGGGSKAGAAAPGLGRFKGKGFLREGGNRNPPSLKRLFGDFLAGQKVTRGPGPGRPRRWQVCRRFAPDGGAAEQKATLHCNPLLALRATSPVGDGGGTGERATHPAAKK